MPSAEELLPTITAAVHATRWLAVVWHGVLLVVLVVLASGQRPSRRLALLALALPLASVSAVAAWAGIAFNAIVFAALVLAAVGASFAAEPVPVESGSTWARLLGGALIAFGWFYPHFVDGNALAYAIASPFAVIPCPTLAVVSGFLLRGGGLGSRTTTLLFSAATLFYGLVGVFRLGVVIDVALLAGSAGLFALTLRPGERLLPRTT